MKIVNHNLPTEGIFIAGMRFLPGEAKDVERNIAEELIRRKGFVLAEGKKERGDR